MAEGRFDSTRLMPGRTGRNDKIVPGMKVYAVDQWHNVALVTITAVSSAPTRNIRAVDPIGRIVTLSVWQIRSTAPDDETPEAIERWLNA